MSGKNRRARKRASSKQIQTRVEKTKEAMAAFRLTGKRIHPKEKK